MFCCGELDNYRPHMRRGNVFVVSVCLSVCLCVCLCVCVSIRAVIFDVDGIETFFLAQK